MIGCLQHVPVLHDSSYITSYIYYANIRGLTVSIFQETLVLWLLPPFSHVYFDQNIIPREFGVDFDIDYYLDLGYIHGNSIISGYDYSTRHHIRIF